MGINKTKVTVTLAILWYCTVQLYTNDTALAESPWLMIAAWVVPFITVFATMAVGAMTVGAILFSIGRWFTK